MKKIIGHVLAFVLGMYFLWTRALHSAYKDQKEELEKLKSENKNLKDLRNLENET